MRTELQLISLLPLSKSERAGDAGEHFFLADEAERFVDLRCAIGGADTDAERVGENLHRNTLLLHHGLNAAVDGLRRNVGDGLELFTEELEGFATAVGEDLWWLPLR